LIYLLLPYLNPAITKIRFGAIGPGNNCGRLSGIGCFRCSGCEFSLGFKSSCHACATPVHMGGSRRLWALMGLNAEFQTEAEKGAV